MLGRKVLQRKWRAHTVVARPPSGRTRRAPRAGEWDPARAPRHQRGTQCGAREPRPRATTRFSSRLFESPTRTRPSHSGTWARSHWERAQVSLARSRAPTGSVARSHWERRALPVGASRAPTGTSPRSHPLGRASGTFKGRLEKRVVARGARLAAGRAAPRRGEAPSPGPTRRREWEARHYPYRARGDPHAPLPLGYTFLQASVYGVRCFQLRLVHNIVVIGSESPPSVRSPPPPFPSWAISTRTLI